MWGFHKTHDGLWHGLRRFRGCSCHFAWFLPAAESMSVGLSGCHVCCQICIAHEPYPASFFVSCSADTDPGPFVMAKKQQNLKDLWLSATPGRLSPWQQAKALALREVNMELHGGKVHLSWICARLTKGGGGHPQKGSLHAFFHRVDSVPEWFPW